MMIGPVVIGRLILVRMAVVVVLLGRHTRIFNVLPMGFGDAGGRAVLCVLASFALIEKRFCNGAIK